MKKILFCTPSHDGKVNVDYLRGCLDVQKNAHETHFYVDYFWQEHGSDIVKGREGGMREGERSKMETSN